MKKVLFTLLVLSLALITNAQKFRKYPFKTGKVEYELTGNTTGKQTLYWAEYGYKEVTIEETKTKMFGQTTIENSTTLFIGDNQYTWNDQDERVFKMSNPIAQTWEENGYDEEDLEEFSLETMKSLGFEKIGTEKILGKKCDVYKGMGKIWVWEGLPIKTTVKILGTTSNIEAKDIDTNCRVSSSVFELPEGREVVDEIYDMGSTNNNDSEEDIQINPEELKEGVENAIKSLFGGN